MSKKRTASESSNDEQTTEGSDPVSQQRHNAKRAKLVSLSDTTLQDLPFELLEYILVKVVAMEVKDMKMAKSVWKQKADLVINRLRTVCSQWNSICATDFFRNEIHRTLDGTAQEPCRLEMLHQYPIQHPVYEMTATNDEIFMLCRPHCQDYVINVFDCNNMAEVKVVIPLPGIYPRSIKCCSVSNCVYVHVHKAELDQSTKGDSVLRITKAEDQLFKISPWITDLKLSILTISVSVNGSLITLSRPNPTVVSIYAVDGSLQHNVMLSQDIYGFRWVRSVIQKSNGNLVLVLYDDQFKRHLMEIDTFGSVVRRYQPALRGQIDVDIYGRILINDGYSRFELLDSEFNRLDFTGLQQYEGLICNTSLLHFNSQKNEIHLMCIYDSLFPKTIGLAIFRFI